MKKTQRKVIRFDEHTMLKIEELSEIYKTNVATIIRAMCLKTINEMQDEKGNWKLSEQFNKRKASKKKDIGKRDERSVPEYKLPEGRSRK